MGQWVQDKKVRSCERSTTEVRVSRTRDPQSICRLYRAIGAEWQPKQGGICGAVGLRGCAALLTLAMLAHRHKRSLAHHHHSQSLRVLTRSRVLTTALLAVANRQTTDASRSANSCDTIARCALQRANPTPIYNQIALIQRPVLSDSCKCERERTESQIGVGKHRCRGNALPTRRDRITSCTAQAHLINNNSHGTLL